MYERNLHYNLLGSTEYPSLQRASDNIKMYMDGRAVAVPIRIHTKRKLSLVFPFKPAGSPAHLFGSLNGITILCQKRFA